ncbi:LacI family DNA-binding transcriptional regulator [Actinoplanes regularis]|uniref:Transcriptional regulator, LacI family n=1 Tax=Actinoplanes regularis TaxID=52697 RepID=A0A238UT75_9ACTN|nr:LacI family DNA-binding transcriptional regulator [Actinoplanes regularis]GIE84452.1 LacI family transcriptional regulator [Actinoplanes regularis]SNR25238.1 transcriptional regulator, LacI family [Actinoplanes regularis]
MPRPRPATIRDVAALAGVSVGTASKALNGRGSLRAETVARVRRAAGQLDFRPNQAARSLHADRTYTVGMITTDTIGRFSIPLLIGAEDILGAGQVSVLLCDARDDPIRERHHLQVLLSRRVDGIIVTGRRAGTRAPVGTGLPVPVVYAFISSTEPGDCSVVPDETGGIRLAADHLRSTGRTRLVHVTGPAHHHSARVRAEALTDLVAEPLFGEWSEAWGRRAAGLLLARGLDLDGVVCGNDQIARGMTEALREAGRDVPREVAVTGFDNWDVIAEASRPPLTSVDMDLEGLGRAAAGLLLEAVAGNPAPGVHRHPSRLIIRDSTVR